MEVEGAVELMDAILDADVGEDVREVAMGLRQLWEEPARAEGEARGETLGQARILLKQLRLRFGELPEDAVARVEAASIADFDPWADRVLTAEALDAVWSS